MTRTEINDFIKAFIDSLPEGEQAWIGRPEIRARKTYKFKVKIDPEYIWEVKEAWGEFIKDNWVTLSGSTPYLVVERSPEKQKIFNKMRKTYKLLEQSLKDGFAVIPDWRSKEFTIKKKAADGEMQVDLAEEVLVTIEDDSSLSWNQAGLQLVGKSEEQMAAVVA